MVFLQIFEKRDETDVFYVAWPKQIVKKYNKLNLSSANLKMFYSTIFTMYFCQINKKKTK